MCCMGPGIGYGLLGILLWGWSVQSAPTVPVSDSERVNDLCSLSYVGGQKFLLDEGDTGTLIAENVHPRTGFMVRDHRNSSKQLRRCVVELSTCPSCHLKLEVDYVNIPCSSEKADHFLVKESLYEAFTIFCNDSNANMTYESLSRSVLVEFIFSVGYENAFSVHYTAVKNKKVVSGSVVQNSTGVLTSPHFPSNYPRDFSNEVTLVNTDPNGLVQLMFEDFQLTPWSFIEVFDSKASRIEVLSGSMFRPQLIVSTTSSITMKFYANGGRGPGYRVLYSFVNGSGDGVKQKPILDCGGWVDNVGGAITMMKMAPPAASLPYDCVWLVKPQLNFQSKPILSLRIVQFTSSNNSGTELEIRQGFTSIAPLLDTISLGDFRETKELMSSYDVGFYVRLRGVLDDSFKLAIIYTSYNNKECFSFADFMCQNHRCIRAELRCDGFDHCGDGSDETPACNLGFSGTPQDPNWWYAHTPNYYFPKSVDLAGMGATTVILMVATLGVLIFIGSLVALLYRMSSHTRLLRERQARLDFLRGQIAGLDSPVQPEEPPPIYESPPDYSEILKVVLANATNIQLMGNRFQQTQLQIPPSPDPSLAVVEESTEPELHHVSETPLLGTPLLNIPPTSGTPRPRRGRGRGPRPGRGRVDRPSSRCSNSQPVSRCSSVASNRRLPDSPPPSYDESYPPTPQISRATLEVEPEGAESSDVELVPETELLSPSGVGTEATPSFGHVRQSTEERRAAFTRQERVSDAERKAKTFSCDCPGACGCSTWAQKVQEANPVDTVQIEVEFQPHPLKNPERNVRGLSMPGIRVLKNRSLDIFFSQTDVHSSQYDEPRLEIHVLSNPEELQKRLDRLSSRSVEERRNHRVFSDSALEYLQTDQPETIISKSRSYCL